MIFGLTQSFDVDGRLAASTREEAFTLGVEWGIVWGRLKSAAPFAEFVRLENRDRISTMLAAQGRHFAVSPAHGGFVSFSVRGLN